MSKNSSQLKFGYKQAKEVRNHVLEAISETIREEVDLAKLQQQLSSTGDYLRHLLNMFKKPAGSQSQAGDMTGTAKEALNHVLEAISENTRRS